MRSTDNIEVYFFLYRIYFDVEIYRKLEKYIDNCNHYILPREHIILDDTFETYIPYSGKALREANLDICNIYLIHAAKNYLAKFRVEYANYKKKGSH